MNIGKNNVIKFLENIKDEKQKWFYNTHFRDISTLSQKTELADEIIALERSINILKRM